MIIRAPRVFPIMWTLVSPLIDETSREKFLFYGGNDYQDPGGLVDYIDHEHIPEWLGGASAREIPEGGLVPKSYYMSVQEFEKDQSPGPHLLEESFYHSTSLSKGQVHEGLIHISDKGSVITWDFDVLRNDVVFTVYRLNKAPVIRDGHGKSPSAATPTEKKDAGTAVTVAPAASSHNNNSNSLSASAAGTASSSSSVEGSTSAKTVATNSSTAGGSNNHPTSASPAASSFSFTASTDPTSSSCIDKAWKEGTDFVKVENSIVCHDGESIQGSHVTSHVGTYVLQWKFFEKPMIHSSPLDVIDSMTQHKAKVMYYYETLNSLDYKGSMTSLQSCQSGFSTISKASAGKHSTSGVSSGVSSSHSLPVAASASSMTMSAEHQQRAS